jgi:aminoglycoside phosphotransferase (APT) family kinase protein
LPALISYLADRLPGIDPGQPLSAHLFTGGRSNLTYRLTQGSSSWVLRRPPLGNVLPSAHDMRREHTVLTGLVRLGLPVPRPLLLCTDEVIIGAPFMLMEFVDGVVLGTESDVALLSATTAEGVSATTVEALVALHRADPAAADLDRLGRPDGYLQRQVSRWTEQWKLTKTRELDLVDELSSWLAERTAALPAGLPSSLVHGDYRLDNLILDKNDHHVRAVLDWELSTLGDPVADLAVLLVYWTEPADVLRRRVPVALGVTDGPGFWDRKQLVEAYARESGAPLEHLDLCVALQCFKLGVVFEQLHRRTLQGQQMGVAADDWNELAGAAPALMRIGLEVAHGGGISALGR